MPLSPTEIYHRCAALLRAIPEFDGSAHSEDWLARAFALVEAGGSLVDTVDVRMWMNAVEGDPENVARSIARAVRRAMSTAELKMPAQEVTGEFILVDRPLDALRAVGRVLATATRDIFIVDPYLDQVFVTDYAGSAPEHVTLRLLADSQNQQTSQRIPPSIARWVQQYGAVRPIEAKVTSARQLHDRLIVVDGVVWDVSQSFHALARRSPATISKCHADQNDLKRDAYETFWTSATRI